MTNVVPRTYDRMISENLTVLVYADGDLTLDVHDQHGIIFEPPQLRELRAALGQLTAGEPLTTSLGEDRLGDEAYLEWDESTVSLYKPALPLDSVELTRVDAIALEKELVNLGY